MSSTGNIHQRMKDLDFNYQELEGGTDRFERGVDDGYVQVDVKGDDCDLRKLSGGKVKRQTRLTREQLDGVCEILPIS